MENLVHEGKLITVDGKEINLSCPDDIWDDVWQSIKMSFDQQALWNCGNWSDLIVMFGDYKLDFVDMHKIIGTWF